MGADGIITLYNYKKLIEILAGYEYDQHMLCDLKEKIKGRYYVSAVLQELNGEQILTDYSGENNDYEPLYETIYDETLEGNEDYIKFNDIVRKVNEKARLASWEIWT